MKYLAILSLLFFSSCKSSNTDDNTLIIKNKKLNIEIADTNKKREQGLMNRASLPKDDAMLFIFDRESVLSFWMKNTLIPLSIAYINKDCAIIDIQQMQPADKNDLNPKTYPSKAPALYALETNINWYKNNNIKVGDKITIDSKKVNICNLKK